MENGMAKSRKKKIIIGLLVVCVLAVLVVVAVTQNRVEKKKVKVEEAKTSDITAMVTATGRVEAKKEVKISADVMGRIIELPIIEGQSVKPGDLLVQIDPAAYEADVQRSAAALKSSEALLERAELAYGRNKELFERNLLSKEAFDLSRSDYNSALAMAAQAKASLDQSKNQLSKTTIRSPIEGVITSLNSEKGENVVIGTMNNPGTVIMVVSDLSAIEVKADVDETDIALVSVGQEVSISLDAFPDTTFKGKVTEIGNSAIISGVSSQDQVVNFLVTILIEDPLGNIRPGMSATVDIATSKRNNVIGVPIQAIVMRPLSDTVSADEKKASESVVVAKEAAESVSSSDSLKDAPEKSDKKDDAVEGVFMVKSGKAKFVPVKTGIADQQNIEILKGVAQSDSVITGSYKILRELESGDIVEPEKKGKGKAGEKEKE
ncbi:MAG: hypothetical protein CO189_12275 [candidate division Zixibacteria bacterium CG_4_9_14_3_um_filter_46_8]|nr:MAG: hypothetical protein CO189_12275 [candidate division Zixibacteria bacterium CG_4_9_14_3_um_filter_46_8]